ncbi:MAG: hypothetical protein PVH17_12340, partial [Anaerolineae bacterium]
MENLLVYLPFLVPVVVAQFGERKRWAQYATYGLLAAINIGLLGIAGLALLNEVVQAFMPKPVEPQTITINWLGVAAACLATSILAIPPLIPAVRRWLARSLPIEPKSTVHATALTFAVYQIGLSFGQMAVIGDLENLTKAGTRLTIWDVVLTGVPLTLFALAGVGLFIRRNGQSTLERLGLHRPTWKQLGAAVGLTVFLLALDLGVNLAWQEVNPTSHDLMDRVIKN